MWGARPRRGGGGGEGGLHVLTGEGELRGHSGGDRGSE